MIVFVNEQRVEVCDKITLTQLLVELKMPTKGIAIAIGQEIVPAREWDSYALKEQVKVLIIRATQGG